MKFLRFTNEPQKDLENNASTACTSAESIKQHFRTSMNFSYFKWGFGANHLWVSDPDNRRILFIEIY